ncbi:hypothetical protein RRG08_001350 [Elysia crispata]|uniref:Uncharacterized protein n=1 Tax=Elysia crispata TaxID=231223 RepID=A0AAE1AXB4_9GAST|nr:hypothetical protein RRG08_001350 [Elysia crispata]
MQSKERGKIDSQESRPINQQTEALRTDVPAILFVGCQNLNQSPVDLASSAESSTSGVLSCLHHSSSPDLSPGWSADLFGRNSVDGDFR